MPLGQDNDILVHIHLFHHYGIPLIIGQTPDFLLLTHFIVVALSDICFFHTAPRKI